MKDETNTKKSKQILVSASLATLLITMFTNPLDVIKVRLIKDTMNCRVKRDPLKCQAFPNFSLSNQAKSFEVNCNNISHISDNSGIQQLQEQIVKAELASTLQKKTDPPCHCIPYKSNYKVLKYIIQTEGIKTLRNGLKQAIVAASLNNVTYLYSYEQARNFVKKYTNHQIILPLASSTIARTITSSIIFPFDYWKTIQQGVEGHNRQAGYKMVRKPRSGLRILLKRDILFSGMYWILTENTRELIKYFRNNLNKDIYDDKLTLVLSNAIGGSFAGLVAASLTLPLDVIKTRRQLYPVLFEKKSDLSVLIEIYKKEGFFVLFTGYRARVTKIIIACGGVLTLYEFFNHIFQKRKWFEQH